MNFSTLVRQLALLSSILAITALLSCHKSNSDDSGSSNPCAVLSFSGSAHAGFATAGIFTQSPIATASISAITPLGNLNPPGHTYPTDHMYIVPTSSTAGANNVVAAAPGTVISVYQPGGTDYKIIIKVDQSFYYYYDHLTLANGIAVGATVMAGQVVGTNSGLAGAVDFGVYNFNNTPLSGILNSCLLQSEAYVDSPLVYYSGSLQTTLQGLAGNSNGKIDYDQSGKLVGNWVLAGHTAMDSNAVQLAFVYHVASSSLRIAVGGTLTGGGNAYGVQGGAPDFNTITTSSGQVDYKLYVSSNGDSSVSGTQYGVLSVQMLSDSQIKVEIFAGNGLTTGTFDGSAQIYNR